MKNKQYHVILDTDIGLDPDDSVALMLAAYSPEIRLEMVLTEEGIVDSYLSAKNYLESMNSKVKLVQGSKHVYSSSESFKEDYMAEIDKALLKNSKIFYVGIGQMNNLANYLKVNENDSEKMKQVREKMTIFQMGGSSKNKPSFNFLINSPAAKYVLSKGITTYLVTTQVTNNEKIRLDTASEFYREIRDSQKDSLKLLSQQIREFNRFYMHDPLTLASVFKKNIVTFEPKNVEFNDNGLQNFIDNKKSRIFVSVSANYQKLINLVNARVAGMNT